MLILLRANWSIETIFEDSIWTYVEPNAGLLSACLPFLAKIFGHSLMNWLDLLTTLGSKTASLLGLHSKSDASKADTIVAGPRTHRAAHESYELGQNDGKRFTKLGDGHNSHESVRQLV